MKQNENENENENEIVNETTNESVNNDKNVNESQSLPQRLPRMPQRTPNGKIVEKEEDKPGKHVYRMKPRQTPFSMRRHHSSPDKMSNIKPRVLPRNKTSDLNGQIGKGIVEKKIAKTKTETQNITEKTQEGVVDSVNQSKTAHDDQSTTAAQIAPARQETTTKPTRPTRPTRPIRSIRPVRAIPAVNGVKKSQETKERDVTNNNPPTTETASPRINNTHVETVNKGDITKGTETTTTVTEKDTPAVRNEQVTNNREDSDEKQNMKIESLINNFQARAPQTEKESVTIRTSRVDHRLSTTKEPAARVPMATRTTATTATTVMETTAPTVARAGGLPIVIAPMSEHRRKFIIDEAKKWREKINTGMIKRAKQIKDRYENKVMFWCCFALLVMY